MGSNSFGNIFSVTTWGESHGKAIGAVIDGCPAGVEISEQEIREALLRRAPGKSLYTSTRQEEENVEILSGVFEGRTTGTPISILIPNRDADSSKYDSMKEVLRPGHANFTYLEKYGFFDHRGGGRASGRETACRVAAGCLAKKVLSYFRIDCFAFLEQVGDVKISTESICPEKIYTSSIFCPDRIAEEKIQLLLTEIKEGKDSIGAVVGFVAEGLPIGLGDPVYEKLEANLAKAMLSIPATKGFEIGSGFQAASMRGSSHNDIFTQEKERVSTVTNHAGGVLGGISTGMPLYGKVAFKPTSSIQIPQETLSLDKKKIVFNLPEGSRHDPCVAIRAVPVIEAMLALVLIDAILMHRSSTL